MVFLDIVDSEFGSILIGIDQSSGSQIYYQKGWCQSESDKNGVSYAPYIHAMYGFIMQMPAMEILMIGCGGGTLATMLARAGRHVTVIDIDPAAIDLAQRYFAMGPGVAAFVGDGLAWLSASQTAFDCIIVDAFDGVDIPLHLRSPVFFAVLGRHLSPQGTVLMNVVEADDDCAQADEVAAGLAEAGLPVRLLEENLAKDRNVIVLAGAVQQLRKPSLLVPPESPSEQLSQDLDRMRFRAG